MARLFLSYRAATAAQHAGRLYDRLAAHFGNTAICYDRDAMSPGELWRARIRQELQDAVAVLAVIDREWLASLEKQAEDEDVVRFELETAIGLRKTIIPILVGGAQMPRRHELPPVLERMLDRHGHAIDDSSTTKYAESVASLIAALEILEGFAAPGEAAVVELLLAKDYAAAERLLMCQPATMRQRADLSVYLALARLAGRSFNALYPAEREAIEALLRRARAASSTWELPMLLLAILEIDYYRLHGLASDDPVPPAEVLRLGATALDRRSRSLLSSLKVSRRARRELELDVLLAGAAHD